MNKELIRGVLASLIVGLISVPKGYAAFQVIPGETFEYTARAQTSGDGLVDIRTIQIENTNNTTTSVQEILWPTVDQNMINANKWILANQMVEIETRITTLSGGVQLVTDNKGTGANPMFDDPTKPTSVTPPDPLLNNNPDSNPAGLVLDYNGNHSYTLPVAWTIKSSTKEVSAPLNNSSNGLKPSDPENGPSNGTDYRFQWLYMVDKQTPIINWNGSNTLGDEVNGIKDGDPYRAGADYQRIIDYRGRHVGQGETEFVGGPGTKTSYVYFQANFETALFGTESNPVRYKTNKLTFEAFTE